MWALETLHEPLWQRLTWTLLHFLWQGLAVAVVAATLLRAWPVRRARNRYVICLLALVAMAACPLVTFVLTEVPESATASRDLTETQVEVPAASEPGPELVANETRVHPGGPVDRETQRALARSEAPPPLAAVPPASGSPDVEATADLSELGIWRGKLRQGVGAIQPYALIAWVAGVLALAARLSISWLHVRWLARARRAIPADLAAKATTLGCRLGLRFPPRVCASERIREAIVVGLWRPLVLLPASWLAEMTPEVLEAVIAHELAHIRRWDLWMNLLQRLVEMFLFYHPAVWWLSRRVGLEREMCTDELAVGVTNKRMAYATALEQLGRMRLGRSTPQFGASVGDRKMVLLNRVGNILGLSASDKKTRWWPVALMALAVPLAIWLVSMNITEVVGDTTVPPTAEKLSKADLKRWIERANSSVQSESDAAVEALVAMGPGVAQEMIPLLKSGRSDRLGMKVLERLAREPSVQRILVKAIEEARDNGTPNVIHCALVALGKSGNVAHVDFTATFLETHDIAAMSALATLGGDRARDHLIGAFDIVPTELWFMLARTLERLGDSAAVPELKKRLAQVELPPNDRFPNATVGAMTGAIAALSGEKEAFTTTTHCQGQHFRYPFGPPGVPKTFSVNPPRDHFVRLPKVDPQSKAGREAIWKAMEEATEGPGFTIDGNEVVAFHGLKMAPLWPDGRPYPTTLYDWLRQTSHQVLRKLVDQEKQTGRCIIPKSGLLVTRDPAGRLHVLVLKKTSDQYTYNVTVMPQDPNMQLIPVRMDAEDLQFTRVAGCTLYDLESETKNGSLNLSRGHLETMTSKKWQGKNEDALLVVEFANNGVSLAVPGAERFLLSEASDAWEKPERALALLRAAMKEEPKIPGHKIVRRDGAIFHLFPELRTGQKFAFAVRMPEGNPVAGVLEVQTVDRKAETLRIRHRFLPTAAALAAEETSDQATQNDQQTPERRGAAEKAKRDFVDLRGGGAKTAWGKEVEDLQLGLSFDLQDRPCVAGETVGFKLLVRNNSAKATTLIDFEPLLGWMPTVRDADGKRLFVNGQWDGPVKRRKQVVAPGKTLVIGGVSLRLDEPWAGPSNDPPHISLKPGKYLVSQTYRFEEEPEATFSGELTSGELALTVAENASWKHVGSVVPPRVEVRTEAPGLSAEEVESLVTVPLENAFGGISSLQTISSKSVPGRSTVVLIFQHDTDLLRARQLVQERLAVKAPRLPAAARAPVILPLPASTSRGSKTDLSDPASRVAAAAAGPARDVVEEWLRLIREGDRDDAARFMARGKNENADDVLSMTVLLEAAAKGNVVVKATHVRPNVAIVISKPLDEGRSAGQSFIFHLIRATHLGPDWRMTEVSLVRPEEIAAQLEAFHAKPVDRPVNACGFGPMLERTMQRTSKHTTALDLDADRLLRVPNDFDTNRNVTQDPIKWIVVRGIDVMPQCNPNRQAELSGLGGMLQKVRQVENKLWNESDAAQVRKLLATCKQGMGMQLRASDGSYPVTYVFETFPQPTGESRQGILQILAIDQNEQAIKVRYQLVGALRNAEGVKAWPPDAVKAVFESLRSELVEIGADYPEFAGARDIRVAHRELSYGMDYRHNCTVLQRGYRDDGPNAAYFRFEIYSLPKDGDPFPFATTPPAHRWPSLNLVGWSNVYVGENSSPGVEAKVRDILRRHVAMIDHIASESREDQVDIVAEELGNAAFGPVMERAVTEPRSKATTYLAPRQVRLYHADRSRERGTPVVLDLASGELIAQPKTADDEAIAKYWDQLGRGDLAYPGEGLMILRRGGVELWNPTAGRFTAAKAVYREPRGAAKPLVTGYSLENLPLRLRITSGDGKKFDVTVLRKEPKGDYIDIEYRPLPESTGPAQPSVSGAAERRNETPEELAETVKQNVRQDGWGKSVEGVKCRLHADKPSWQQGRIPDLLADWHNEGAGTWEITLPRGNWELEIDGTRFQPSVREPRNQRVPLHSGEQRQDLAVPVLSNGNLGLKLHDLSPGKHTLRLICMLNSTAPDTAEKPLRVVSNLIEVNVLPIDDDIAWGEPTEGVQCRLRVDQRSWPQGTVPKLFADLHNQGKRDLSIAIEAESWEFEIDGKWHKPSVFRSGIRRYLPLAAGQQQLNVEVWTDAHKKLDELTPGAHTLRLARILPSAMEGPANDQIRVVSNPVEIEVVAAEPQARSKATGGWSDIETVMGSLSSEFAKISSAYPELPDADAIRITRTDVFYGLKYMRNCTYLGRRGHEDTGPHPVHLRFEVYSLSEQGDPIPYAVRKPDHTWGNLRLVGWTRVYVGKDASPGFADKARQIIDRHVAMVDALDHRAKDTPPPVAKDWSWSMEGVQFRLHTDKSSWPQGTLPELLADFRNRGTRDLKIELEHESWGLEIDGRWHRVSSFVSGLRRWLPLGPGQDQQNLKVWFHANDNLGRKLRELEPGKHTLRVARYFRQGPPEERLRLVSNPIDIEILPSRPAAD